MYGTQWSVSNHQVCYQKGLGTCDALLCVSHTLQSVLGNGQEARIMKLDFSTAVDKVNRQGLFKLCSVGIGGSVLTILTQFLSSRSQHVMVDIFGVNWLTLCQECRRAFFWVRYCPACTPWRFFQFWKISWSVIPMTPLWWLLCFPRR